jgi:hypothetical protein
MKKPNPEAFDKKTVGPKIVTMAKSPWPSRPGQVALIK